MIGAIFFAATLALAGTPEEDFEVGFDRRGYERVKNVLITRPLTTPKRTFDVFVIPTLSTRSPTLESVLRLPQEERNQGAEAGLRLGAKLGLTEDLEVGFTLPPMLFHDGIVFTGPTVEMTLRFVNVDGFEMGVAGASVLPIGEGFSFEGFVPMQLRISEALRLSAAPRVAVLLGNKTTAYTTGTLPITLTAQLAPVLFARLQTGVSTLRFEDISIMAGAEIGFTLRGDYGAFADVALGFLFPTLIEERGQGSKVVAEHWVVALSGRFYVSLPQDRGEKEKL